MRGFEDLLVVLRVVRGRGASVSSIALVRPSAPEGCAWTCESTDISSNNLELKNAISIIPICRLDVLD